MKQVMLHRGMVSVKDVSSPLVDAGTVLVRVHYSYISSGTEAATVALSAQSMTKRFIHDIAGSMNKLAGAIRENGIPGTLALIKEKQHKHVPLGYSCSGQVIAVGANVKNIYPGDYVACAGAGFAHHAELVNVPQQLVVPLKNKESLKQASITTIGAIALQGVRRAQLELGQTICVIGLGLIGQLTVQLAKQAGCRVIGLDIKQERIELAQRHGADLCFNPLINDIPREIDFTTGLHGVDTTIITASSTTGQVLQQAMSVTRRKGRVVLVGDVKIDVDREPFYSKEIDLLISCSYGPGRYDQSYERDGHDYPYAYVRWTEKRNMAYVLSLIENSSLKVDALTAADFPVSQAVAAYEQIQKSGAPGAVLSYGTLNGHVMPALHDPEETIPHRAFQPVKGVTQVSIVGVGGFAKVKIIPLVTTLRNVTIHSVIDTDSATALTVARQYKAQRVGNDIKKVLGDDDVHAVIIATPHAFHAQQAIACLQAGKAVLLEKPAAVTFEQFYQLKQFLKDHEGAAFCVDFNRSCSPFMRATKKAITGRHNPLVLSYRINGNHLPKDHWIQSELHRGRIIGEACHIFELFCFLTGARPASVAVNVIKQRSEQLLVTDNLAVTVGFSDGSICNLVYTSLGSTTTGKEFMEVFVDGKTIIMHDFYSLEGHGLPNSFSQKMRHQDKGHETLMREFFDAIRKGGGAMPIPIDRILTATQLTLIVDKLARLGGGYELLH